MNWLFRFFTVLKGFLNTIFNFYNSNNQFSNYVFNGVIQSIRKGIKDEKNKRTQQFLYRFDSI